MSLFQILQQATSEEDVKTAYISALKLKQVRKNLVDIQTDQVWFEAKHKPTNVYTMFTQLLYYVCHAEKKGEYIPPLLCVIDNEKAALMSTENISSIFKDKKIMWGKSASQVSPELIAQVSPYITDHFIYYSIESDEKAFLKAVKDSIELGSIIRISITPANLKLVFDRWVELIGKELPIKGIKPSDFALLFYADIMHDGSHAVIDDSLNTSLIHKNGKPAFILNGSILELASTRGYQDFWNIYHRPPKEEHRSYLLERRDSLIPLDERQFKGAYYTPLKVVEKAYDLLTATLGQNWQKDFIVWDMCCGVGNLEAKHSNHRNVYMSTLDLDDINVIQTSNNFSAAVRFQYDYLNDDINEHGEINYNLTNKLPFELRELINDSREKKKNAKKILILINPPYGETGTGIGKGIHNKKGIENTEINKLMNYGYASKELFVQFLFRIQKELPNATLAIFSTPKYVISQNFSIFRENWTAKYLDGFVFPSTLFDGIKGSFPISFLIWDMAKNMPITGVKTSILDKKCNFIGEKYFINESTNNLLNKWIVPPKTNDELALPLSNAISISTNPRLKKSCTNMLGYLYASNNDLQHATMETLISSSIYTGGNGGGLYITSDNIWQCAVVFSVRRLVKKTWLNNKDQFLQPNCELPTIFQQDCLIWMLFNGSNLTAGTALDAFSWNNKKWQLKNNFIPFTEQQVGSKRRFSSTVMSDLINDLNLSDEAKNVLEEGRKIWSAFFESNLNWKIREKYLLDDHSDAGWYQIRNSLKESESAIDFTPFEIAYGNLTEKLLPQVFEFGFLKA